MAIDKEHLNALPYKPIPMIDNIHLTSVLPLIKTETTLEQQLEKVLEETNEALVECRNGNLEGIYEEVPDVIQTVVALNLKLPAEDYNEIMAKHYNKIYERSISGDGLRKRKIIGRAITTFRLDNNI